MRIPLIPLLMSMLLSISGCASVTMVSTWQQPAAVGHAYRNFLVVGITDVLQTRQIYEGVLAGVLKTKGVSATPSYAVAGVEGKLSREVLEKAVRTAAADAVLTTRLVGTKKETASHVDYVVTGQGYINPYFDDYAVMPLDLYGYYGVTFLATQQVQTTLSTAATLEANLFDAATAKMVWSGTINVTNPEDPIKASEDIAAVVVRALNKDGLIATSAR
jgi:hypothetical protein